MFGIKVLQASSDSDSAIETELLLNYTDELQDKNLDSENSKELISVIQLRESKLKV